VDSWRGLDLFFGGYDEHLPQLAALVSSSLRTVPLDATSFERRRDSLQRQLANLQLRQPSKLAAYRRSLALESPRYSNRELEAAAKAVTLADVEGFQARLLQRMQIEAFISGNVREDEARSVVQQLHDALPSQPLPSTELPVRRVRRLPLGATLQQFVAASATERNGAVEVYYQIGLDEGEAWVELSLLAQLMNKPFYAALRTQQQLGYVVACGTNELFGVRALIFTVQSATASPTIVQERI
jgi:insulysin